MSLRESICNRPADSARRGWVRRAEPIRPTDRPAPCAKKWLEDTGQGREFEPPRAGNVPASANGKRGASLSGFS